MRAYSPQRAGRSRALGEAGGVTVADFLTAWLSGKQRLRTSTALAYQIHVDRHISPALGSLRLRDLTLEDLQVFYASLRARGLSSASVLRVHATLSSALNAAVRRGLIEVAPTSWVELAPSPPSERVVWSFDQAHTFLGAIQGSDWEAIYRLLLLSGLRRGEVLGLRWTDLDLDQRLISVRQQLVQVGSTLVLNPPKSRRGIRTVGVDSVTVDVLGRRRPRLRLPGQLVFADGAGGPVPPASVSRRFIVIVADLGLPRIRLHDLRHTSASLGLTAGESLVEVSRRLGHSSVKITGDTYSHLDPALTRASADRLAHLCEGPAPDASVVVGGPQ